MMECEDGVQSDVSFELVNMDDYDTENEKPKRLAVASSYLDSDGSYEYLCSEVSETLVLTDVEYDNNLTAPMDDEDIKSESAKEEISLVSLHHQNHTMSECSKEKLIDAILVKLPAKSLVRFRSVSKSWYSRISTPSFIHKHTLKVMKMPLSPQKYFLRKPEWYDPNYMTRHICPIRLQNRYTGSKSDKLRIRSCFTIVGSCNGIICLFNKDVHSITLWNPSIKRKLTVPAYPCSSERVSFGFGFDPISDDYKIVAMSYSYYEATQFCMYSMKTNLWSKIVSAATTKVYHVGFDSNAYFFKGTLHWVVRCKLNAIDRLCILTCDLSTNAFGVISLPIYDFLFYDLMVIKDCLAAICMGGVGEGHLSIWVMREYNNAASWTKVSDIGSSPGSEEMIVDEDLKDSISYNHETMTRSRRIVDSSYKVDMDMCVESLELLDKEIVKDESYFLERHFSLFT